VTATHVETVVERFRAGQRPALARLITWVENDQPAGLRAMSELYRQTGNAHVIGITGPPGAGKSTLTNALIRAYRAEGKRVGVIAVDPSSLLTGGATLGDRIRMLENFEDEGVYIRSMATRGEMGGLSLAVGATTHLLDAFGFDIVLIETVGVGQDEVDIAELADTILLLQVPGTGDAIQAIKAGVLEIADVLVVNKADITGAHDLVRDLRNMLRLGDYSAWRPPIVETIATSGTNVEGLLDAIAKHRAHLLESGEGERRREIRERREVSRMARRWLIARIEDVMQSDEGVELLTALLKREEDPLHVAKVIGQRAAERAQTRD
jgi:LAO/AO transport system kinase